MREDEPCGLCLKPSSLCKIFLSRGSGGKYNKINTERSTGCGNAQTFRYGIAAESTVKNPCSNYASKRSHLQSGSTTSERTFRRSIPAPLLHAMRICGLFLHLNRRKSRHFGNTASFLSYLVRERRRKFLKSPRRTRQPSHSRVLVRQRAKIMSLFPCLNQRTIRKRSISVPRSMVLPQWYIRYVNVYCSCDAALVETAYLTIY